MRQNPFPKKARKLLDDAGLAYKYLESPQDLRNRYASASFLPDGVVIFNVKGNAYRLEVAVAYRTATVSIRWAGTHREYDQRNRSR